MSGADDNESTSSANGSNTPSDIVVEDEQTITKELESEFRDVIDRLDEVKLEPDLEMAEIQNEELDNTCENTHETESIGAVSSASSEPENHSGNEESRDVKPKDIEKSTEKSPVKTKKESKTSKIGSSVFSRLKRLTKFDKPKSKSQPAVSRTRSSSLKDIKVDRLPQYFVAKYLGKKDVQGVFGLHHVRKPVDELVGNVKQSLMDNETVELPLVYMVVSAKGIDIREHARNKIKDKVAPGLIPIDFISYGVQDMKYWRVFTFIVVNEISSRTKQMECHAYLCDSTGNARRLALALGASFSVYKRKLSAQGKPHNFQVELRPPDELAEAFGREEDCEA